MTPATVEDLALRTLELRAERVTADNNVILLLAQQLNENNHLVADLIQHLRSQTASVRADAVKDNGGS